MFCCTCTCLSLVTAFLAYKLLDWLIRKPRVGSLGERYIFVTGADTGFGHEISKRLDKMGCHVLAGCLTEKGEDGLRKACSSRLHTVPLNVANHQSVLDAYEKVKAIVPKGRGLWGVFNNAGISGAIGPAEFLRLEDYNAVFSVNLLGLIDVTTTFLPLVKQARGRVINTASVFGRHTIAGSTPYCCSKYGVESFSDSIRRQLRMFGVSVHLIEPGFHKTNITNTANLERDLRRAYDNAPQAVKDEYGEEFINESVKLMLENFVDGIVSERVSDVIDAYEHAALGLFPRARYVVGKDAKYVWLPLQWMPEWLGDWLLDKLTKFKPIPAALKKK